MRFVSFVAKETNSTIPFDVEAKSNRGINTMRRVVKSKIQKLKPVFEYNKRGRPHGKAAVEMHRTLGCYHMGNMMQGEDEKLEFPLCVGPVYDSYNDDKKGDYHSDDQDNSDVKDELYLLPS
ncbi:hypothetical protein L3X38_042266 [Prunus dulcis]|uniref:Uncharacterized protein n=1 Tax=Prunus dulcis TaxID=3755 RepID=A0AAD4UW84_PRUDU|nr:hypothetical protein L3X38_042266 [Prunus dulcis]